MNPILNAVLLSLVAGLGTSIGGLIVIIKKPSQRVYSFLLGITAGVMISLAFLELVNKAWEMSGWVVATLGFGGGAIFMFLLDFFIPHVRFGEAEVRGKEVPCGEGQLLPYEQRPHRHRRHQNNISDPKLLRTGILLAIGITLHNIPEGIAVGAGFMQNPTFGYFIAMAIMLHNIPEGIATALPLSQCGVNKWVAFRVAFLSGLAEPIGALLAALFLTSFTKLIPGALAFAGGVMMFITLDELIPAARQTGHTHTTALGIIIGSIFVFILSGLFGV